MSLLQLKDVTLRFGDVPLLDSASLTIHAGERVCLIGRNGVGKTSLMRVLTGEESPNSGDIFRAKDLRITRLEQDVPGSIAGTVEQVIQTGVDPDSHEEQWESDMRVGELIESMRLQRDATFESLSGGLKRRTLLARAIAGQPGLLLLDEPTNHLDLPSIQWLEQYLLKQTFALFFVTHDRSFLRRLATRIVELDRGHLQSWDCDYETFLERKAVWLEAEEKRWAVFDKKLAQEEAWLRQGVKARRTRNEGRVQALMKLRRERAQRRERSGTARIELQDGATSGDKVIDVQNVTFEWPEQTVVRDFTTTIWRGDKIGIIGPNGSGKTTLLNLLLGRLKPQSGTVKLGTNLQMVYFDQLRDQIDNTKTVIQNVAGNSETVHFQGRARHVHSYLRDFLFAPDRARMLADRLSGGERNRLLLARLFLQPANVLVLDEPTNDLDLETLELLEALLVEYSGTLLLVSHDRTFLDEAVTSTLVLEGDGLITEVVGGYEEWEALKARRNSSTKRASESARSATGTKSAPAQAKSQKPRRFLNREQRELDEIPARIAALEARQAELTEKLADPAIYKTSPKAVPELQAELEATQREIASAYARWDELESLKAAGSDS